MTPTRTISIRTSAAALVALAVAGAALAVPAATAAPASAAEPTSLNSASGLVVRDIDGGILQEPSAPVGWAEGAEVRADAPATSTPAALRSGYVITTTGTRTVAGVTGARTVVDEARVELRGRVALTVRGLTVGCAPGGRSVVTVDQLLVGDADRTTAAQGTPGTRIALPATAGAYDDDASVTLEAVTTSGTSRTTTGLRITNGDNYEVRDLALGQVTCSDAAQPALEPHRVAGVQVLGDDGARLVEPAAVISGPGAATVTADEVSALGSRTRASGVSATTRADGSVHVEVDAFAQLPEEDAFAEYRSSALRVNHLNLDVTPAGVATVTFDDPTNALFADGRWLNSQDGYIYSKVDEAGEVLLEVRVNERIEHADGTTTVNALHYLDHTGTWPEVVLGQVVVGADGDPGPGPGPDPEPEEGVVPAGTWHAYGLRSTGAVQLEATGLVSLASTREARVAETTDSTGQVRATDLRSAIAPDGASSSVGDLDLFAGSDAAVRLKDLRTVVSTAGTVVTTGGGTVLGHEVAAGRVTAGTTYRLEGTSTTVVLGATTTDAAGLAVTHGLLLSSPDELATTVTAASVTVGRLAPAPTSVRARAIRTSTSYGNRVELRATVAGASAGTVSVRERGRLLASRTIRNGGAILRLPRDLVARKHQLDVSFRPTGAAASSRTDVAVRVVKARPQLRVTSSRARLTIRLGALPVRPRGLVVRVYVAGRTAPLSTRVVGAVTRVSLAGLSRGTHRVRVVLPATHSTTSVQRSAVVRVR